MVTSLLQRFWEQHVLPLSCVGCQGRGGACKHDQLFTTHLLEQHLPTSCARCLGRDSVGVYGCLGGRASAYVWQFQMGSWGSADVHGALLTSSQPQSPSCREGHNKRLWEVAVCPSPPPSFRLGIVVVIARRMARVCSQSFGG